MKTRNDFKDATDSLAPFFMAVIQEAERTAEDARFDRSISLDAFGHAWDRYKSAQQLQREYDRLAAHVAQFTR